MTFLCEVLYALGIGGRVARWLIAIQEYDILVKHIKGTDNYLADILRRNPAGLSTTEIQKLSKPNSIFVNKINLGVDSSVCKDLKRLPDLQSTDPRIEGIREKLAARPDKRDHQHRLEGNLLFRRGNQDSTVWKPMLPECLEMPVIKYVHETLGHSGVDKCTYEINQAYHLKNIGRKVRKFTASCDICQRVKHPNRSVDAEERSHLPIVVPSVQASGEAGRNLCGRAYFKSQSVYIKILNIIFKIIFRLPSSTLYKPKHEGGLGMVNRAKCRTLFIMRILKQCQQKDNITAQWIEQHAHFIQHNNPPHWIPLPQATEYLRVYMQEKAYIGDQANNEPNNKYKKRVYDIIHSAEFNNDTTLPIRMQAKYPQKICRTYGATLIKISETDGMCNSLLNNYVLCLILASIFSCFLMILTMSNTTLLLLRLLIIMLSYQNTVPEERMKHAKQKSYTCDM